MATVLFTAVLGMAPMRAQAIVVVEPPAEESSESSAVLGRSEDGTPAGFIAGYVGLTVVGLTSAAIVSRRRSAGRDASSHGALAGDRRPVSKSQGREARGDTFIPEDPVS